MLNEDDCLRKELALAIVTWRLMLESPPRTGVKGRVMSGFYYKKLAV
jgi:hypothetical protein